MMFSENQPQQLSQQSNIESGIMIQNIEMNLQKDIFLKILCLENKIEKKHTINQINNLIVLYSQLVEHYNMKKDPIQIYFLERIKNYLTKTNSLKLYFKAEMEQFDNTINNINEDEIEDSIFYSDEEASPHKVLREHLSTPLLFQQQSFLRKDSFENLIEQKKQQLRKSISFINYQQAKKSQLQIDQTMSMVQKEEIYDLERKRNERSLKLSVFKEVFLNQDNKKNEVKQIIQNYEEQSKHKDNIVKSDIDQQMSQIQQRIQIKRDNQFKKSLTIELNTPRSHREVPSSAKNARSQNTCENDSESLQIKSDNNIISFQSNDNSNSKNSKNNQNDQNDQQLSLNNNYQKSIDQIQFNIIQNKNNNNVNTINFNFNINNDQDNNNNDNTNKNLNGNIKQGQQNKQNGIQKQNLRIKNFHEKLGITKIRFDETTNKEQMNTNQRIKHLGSLQDESPYSSDENQEHEEQVNSSQRELQNKMADGNQNQNQTHLYNEASLIQEIVSQEHSFSQKESVSPSKYIKDFGYDNDNDHENLNENEN